MKTRCYKIKKEDVIVYPENRKNLPGKLFCTGRIVKGNYIVKMKAEVAEVVLEYLRLYCAELLSDYPDVIAIFVVSQITGCGTTAINNCYNKGYIKSFKKNDINHIPKVYLSEFFYSTYFRIITRESSWHIHTLPLFLNWKKIHDLRAVNGERGAK